MAARGELRRAAAWRGPFRRGQGRSGKEARASNS